MEIFVNKPTVRDMSDDLCLKRALFRSRFEIERGLRREGFVRIAGVDEAGRGPLAGPVVAAAVVLPSDREFLGLDDSKKLSEKERLRLFREISRSGAEIGVGIADVECVDTINVLNATYVAMRAAVQRLRSRPDFVLVDGFPIPDLPLPQMAIVGGDGKSNSIAAASVVAKCVRDSIMRSLHRRYPQYGFERHKGYPTAYHREAIRVHGPSPVHRRSFDLMGENKTECGKRAEDLAVLFLEAEGYRVVERNYRCRMGEIDIIAVEDEVLTFVEVRSRSGSSYGRAEESIGQHKRNRMRRVAEYYLLEKGLGNSRARFDVVAVSVGSDGVPALDLYKDAF